MAMARRSAATNAARAFGHCGDPGRGRTGERSSPAGLPETFSCVSTEMDRGRWGARRERRVMARLQCRQRVALTSADNNTRPAMNRTVLVSTTSNQESGPFVLPNCPIPERVQRAGLAVRYARCRCEKKKARVFGEHNRQITQCCDVLKSTARSTPPCRFPVGLRRSVPSARTPPSRRALASR